MGPRDLDRGMSCRDIHLPPAKLQSLGAGQGRGMWSRQREENTEKDIQEQKGACPSHPLVRGFVMPDKEHLSGRLHRLLKCFANSSYNLPGRKTPCSGRETIPVLLS